MKVHLLDRDDDLDWDWVVHALAQQKAKRPGGRSRPGDPRVPRTGLPWNTGALSQDLELNTVLGAMARDDACIFEIARKVLLAGVTGDLETIKYRQEVLRDCLANAAVVRELYALALEAVEENSKHYRSWFMRDYPLWVLRWSTETLEGLLGLMARLRGFAERHADPFASDGFRQFFASIRDELSADYTASIKQHLAMLKFRNGVRLSARLGAGNKATGFMLHLPPPRYGTWFSRLLRKLLPSSFAPEPPTFGFTLHPRDENGFRALEDIQNRGIGLAATVLGRSAEHVRNFFSLLAAELAFYVGCLNLHEDLDRKGGTVCLPAVKAGDEPYLSFRELYDVALALSFPRRVVGNDIGADGRQLVVVTGANQGGKSTFLRSLGLARLMMQAGMFVAADAFSASVCDGLSTHFKRKEDATMKSGKLDEELARMSEIVEHVTPNSMILFNESFAATNEREGSEIASQIVSALLEHGVRMVFVTHLYEFAHRFYEKKAGNVLFLRADRQPDGSRSFRLSEGAPLQTSYGEDLYDAMHSDTTAAINPASRLRNAGL